MAAILGRDRQLALGRRVACHKDVHVLTWQARHQFKPERTRIEVFDTIWWMHLRRAEPAPSTGVRSFRVRTSGSPNRMRMWSRARRDVAR